LRILGKGEKGQKEGYFFEIKQSREERVGIKQSIKWGGTLVWVRKGKKDK